MNSKHDRVEQRSSTSWIVPLAWLLLAVVAPFSMVWFCSPGAAQFLAPLKGLEDLQGASFSSDGNSVPDARERRASELQWLDSYGWVDREGQMTRVPISEAMQQLLRAGLPAREESEAGN